MFSTSLKYFWTLKSVNAVLAVGNSNGSIGQAISVTVGRSYSDKNNPGKCCKEISQTEGKRVEPWPKTEPSPKGQPWRMECSRDPQPPNYDPYRIKVPDVVVPPLPPSNAKPALDCAKTKGPCSGLKAPEPPPCPPPPHVPFPWIYVFIAGAFCSFVGLIYQYYLWVEAQKKNVENKAIWRPRTRIKRPYHDADLPECVQYLIIGTGVAGWAAYEAIMEYDKKAKIFFVSKDDLLPYERKPMSKHMWWNKEPPDIKSLNYIVEGKRQTMYKATCKQFLDPVKFNRKTEGPALSIASGWCVLRIDATEHCAWVKTMCGEQPIYYERCVLAPGSKAKNLKILKSAPKAVRAKTTVLRSVHDLELAVRRVRENKHVVILGGGPLGTELAWYLGKMNEVVERDPLPDKTIPPPVEVVHLYKDGGILSNILPEYLGKWASEIVKCENVTLMPNTQVYDAFTTPDGRLELTLSNGTSLVTDYVLVAVGAKPRTEMARLSFLEKDRENDGFLVNTEMMARTHLYIAGDAASTYSKWKDTRIRFEHHDNAIETGYIAGANAAGQWLSCNVEPHYWIRLGRLLEMEVIGEVGACMPTVGLFKPCEGAAEDVPLDAEKDCFKQGRSFRNLYKRGMLFYLREEVIVGIIMWNIPPIDDRKDVVTEILRTRPTYKDINLIASLLGFPETECTYHTLDQAPDMTCIKEGVYKTW